MTELNDLIEALRAELLQYGEMLARMDEEETLTMENTAEELLVKDAALRHQEGVIELALRRREQAQRQLAPCLLLPEKASLADIISLLPQHCQSLVRALADETKILSARVRRRANQKRQLPSLSTSFETLRSTYQTTEPGGSGFAMPGGCKNASLGRSDENLIRLGVGPGVMESDATRSV